LDFLESIWPNINRALQWIDDFGEADGDGFVEYRSQSHHGLRHQSWKDSDDAVFHRDGSLAEGPIAMCEVQGYVYAAKKAGARLAAALGLKAESSQWMAEAGTLQNNFDRAFWCEELSTYALALDGNKQPCRVRSSNAGHCLFTGIVRAERAEPIVRTLFRRESRTGWGIRTIPRDEARYNPMGYHTGAIWPHDNALIALGMARYGFERETVELLTGLFEASLHFDLHRMPELFCGFERIPGEGPIPYPLACSPQAWSAASIFLLVQACLGLDIDVTKKRLRLVRPKLPMPLQELRIYSLEIGDATVDLMFSRQDEGVNVRVMRQQGDVRVVVAG
jgi:glycogen debranching enzyme